MQIDRRVTNGLAWAGVLLVVGIPVADLVSAQFMGDKTSAAPAQIAVVEPIAPMPAPLSQRPVADEPEVELAVAAPVKPAAPAVVAPAAPTAAQTASVVDSYLQSGKGLPSYITGAPSAAPVAAPTQVATTPPARTPIIAPAETPAPTDPVQVASIPAKVAPMPMPLSMRPQTVTVPVAVMQPNEPLIVAPSANGPRPPVDVTAEDLEDWETGPLSDFLARRQAQAQARSGDESQGFFLDEAPVRTRQPDRVIGPANDDFFFPFVN